MNKLVIFDLDGTLCDTLDDLTYFINDSCKKFGFPPCEKKVVRTHVCHASLEFFRLCLGVEKDDERLNSYHDYYSEQYKHSGSPRTRLYDGMEETLLRLKENGYKLAILTNKTQYQTDSIYDRYIKHIGFDKVIGIREGVVAKPDPTEIFNLMKEFNADKENTYFIGDGDTDVLASLNAGVNLITVTYGYRDKDILEKLGATCFVDTPKEIADIILGTANE
jgi:phosphoglycolate phosphatase